MTLIREADEGDSDALNELQKKCPMGTSLIIGVDSSPDYFARSRPFKDWHVLVAFENDAIVGSAAFAINDTNVGGVQVKTAYEYGFMVDPLHRRKGIAEQLQARIEQAAMDSDVDLLHLDVIEDNFPSIGLFSKMGFEKVRDCETITLMPYKRQKITEEASIRSMEEADVDNVVNLINEMYRGYDFFTPFRPEDFREYIGRIAHFNLRHILLLESNGNLEACLGYWEYNKVRKYIVEKMNQRLKAQTLLIRLLRPFAPMPHIPKLGEPLLSYNLATAACRNPENVTELLKKVINIALDDKINFIHATIDPANPMSGIFSRFRFSTKMKMHVFAKPLKKHAPPSLGEEPVYIDVTEM
jgi:ribosomal protein S18 acetylase RimI-like enzyme